MTEVTSKQKLQESTQNRTLVDFYADWCGPCRQIAPVLEEVGAPVVKVDVDENPEIAQEYGVMGLPTIAVFENGQEVRREVGAMNKSDIQNLYEA